MVGAGEEVSNPAHMTPGYVHVHPSDNDFKARMRFHQSWYREHHLQLDPSTNPHSPDKMALFGNRINEEDGKAGKNFLTTEIAQVAEGRMKTTASILKSRLRQDLLSSQPMCFNLFGPLVKNQTLATRLIRSLPGPPDDLDVTNVVIEYAPEPRSDFLNDGTSHDAFVEYKRSDGSLGFVGIETKLTEPFGASVPFSEGYSRWMRADTWWWKPGAENAFESARYNQLWRNHLLAFAMLRHELSKYAEGYAAVLYHDEDHPCERSLDSYRPLLTDDAQETILVWPLSLVVDAWEPNLQDDNQRRWLSEFHLRYLNLAASQAAWDVYQSEHA